MKKIFSKFEELLLVLSLAVMVILIFGQVIGRYILQSAPVWTEELARYIHIFQVWIGASYAVKLNQHIRVEAFINLFHGKVRKVLEITGTIIWFSLALFLAIFGTKLVIDSMNYAQVSPAIQIPFWILFLAIPLGGAGMAIRLVQQIITYAKKDFSKEKEELIV
ncbi:TRAP transporter small permease [Pseudogracilibacillus auburnensis]|uniref:TRAP-type C4-dicarboxylate transport system permease small subunit n=1 Tax=Pseudogracilibacillus auburnensis TaxID=1494959 RepID=A0A2V3VYN5_9BACI|nr:TRAP transporter small permease [Pseudogracilibacillus auburnensis]MBO1002731.1 TRAP transporter small permease [Pseudogracilibacillus auburnensis]PXW81699.1 TRAP-type C4-dicarboxylate transport system permease small subunit [Pseudogracilibacillus auburnensis]